MRHQVAERDRLPEGRWDLEVEVSVDVFVETELLLLNELHRSRPGDQL